MINVSDFQNYREYLKEYYLEQKANRKSFSYRAFAEKANLRTSSFLYDVIQGKKNLTKSTVIKVSDAIGHKRDDALYFEYLVFFNQAKTINEKNYFYQKLLEIKRPVLIENIEKSRYELYESWYHSVIRELVTFLNFDNDFSKLGKTLISPISERDAKRSVELLQHLGFIELTKDGTFHQIDKLINVKPNMVDMLIIQKFQIAMLEHAIKSYDLVDIYERISTSTTFSISEKTFDLIKKRTREFQRDIMELASIDNEPDRVYQMTINIFPMSKRGEK
jgi:uncharacterized protein (TIGR02147 family)